MALAIARNLSGIELRLSRVLIDSSDSCSYCTAEVSRLSFQVLHELCYRKKNRFSKFDRGKIRKVYFSRGKNIIDNQGRVRGLLFRGGHNVRHCAPPLKNPLFEKILITFLNFFCPPPSHLDLFSSP